VGFFFFLFIYVATDPKTGFCFLFQEQIASGLVPLRGWFSGREPKYNDNWKYEYGK
jgi:hypothetical protein